MRQQSASANRSLGLCLLHCTSTYVPVSESACGGCQRFWSKQLAALTVTAQRCTVNPSGFIHIGFKMLKKVPSDTVRPGSTSGRALSHEEQHEVITGAGQSQQLDIKSFLLDSTSITPITRAQVHHHVPKTAQIINGGCVPTPIQSNVNSAHFPPKDRNKGGRPNQEAPLPQNI